ncbi:hypothetical protein ACIG63_45715 [Streptomyces antimycoticus]|uniref:hypothetical protein n=1 Tax=Streptomyces antimycoticus TaxID=68175 RepID=UPI0037D3FA05
MSHTITPETARARTVALLALLIALVAALALTYRGAPPAAVVQPAGLAYVTTVALAAVARPLHLGHVVLATTRYIALTVAGAVLIAWSGGRSLLYLAGVIRCAL